MIRKRVVIHKRILALATIILMALPACCHCRYCISYEDFLEGRWEPIDTIVVKKQGKGNYTLTTGNKALDKTLNKEAFIVMQADTMYLNCCNLRYENTCFSSGFTRAMRIGERSLLFVNRKIGREVQGRVLTAAVMFGALGAAISAGSLSKQQVCYLISWGANKKGLISIRMIDDALIDQMIAGRDDLHDEYYAEENTNKRLFASHIIPILEKAGLFNQVRR